MIEISWSAEFFEIPLRLGSVFESGGFVVPHGENDILSDRLTVIAIGGSVSFAPFKCGEVIQGY